MRQPLKPRLLSVLVLILVLVLTLLLVIYRNEIRKFAGLGYPGIFIVSMLSNATLVFPIPGVLFTSAMGAVFQPFWVAVVAGSGAAIGELTGYMAGLSGQAVIEKYAWYVKMKDWVMQYGDLAVLILAVIPNPIFDLTGMAAGALRMPLWRFYIWCWIGKVVKMLFFAYGGAAIISTIN